jgi:hypothetical protein
MKMQFFYAALIAVLISACQNGAEKESDNRQVADITLVDVQNKATPNMAASATVATDSTGSPESLVMNNGQSPLNPDWDKKIIKTANVSLELKDYANYNTLLHNKLNAYGAYIAGEHQEESDYQISNEVTIKVPVNKFDDLLNSLPAEGVKLLQKNVTAEDVTAEMVDTKARMEAKKQVRDRYLALLNQAHTIKDILEVESQVNTIQEDIEAAEGRVKYLSHQSAYSTIQVKYFQYLNGADGYNSEPPFFKRIFAAFQSGAGIISGLFLGIITLWPLVIIAVLVFMYLKKRKQHKPITKIPQTTV